MNYKIQKLDGRHSYRRWFEYYIGFRQSMSYSQGPLQFAQAQKWFFDTYGWSAEIRQWADIHRWTAMGLQTVARPWATEDSVMEHLPAVCNRHWSWTNGATDLRIYLATDQELAFFQLAHPVDQKSRT